VSVYTVSKHLRQQDDYDRWYPPDWTEQALCAQADPAEWYPEKGGSSLRAKRICRRCPVREPCLGDALDRNDAHGVWGGLSPEERDRIAAAYRRGTSLPVIVAAADADQDARRAAAAEHSRETALAASAIASAAYAARRAAIGPESPRPQEVAA